MPLGIACHMRDHACVAEVLRQGKAQLSRAFVGALVVAALATGGFVFGVSRGMWTEPGSAGMGPLSFVLIWSAMMTAVMLPSVTPFARLYLRSMGTPKPARATVFIVGYLGVWSATGLAAYALALLVDHIVVMQGLAPRLLAAAVFGVAATYSFTNVKSRMLAKCRNPIGLLIEYGARTGWARDLRAGVDHGATCLACCWALMLLMAVFGMMNVVAMVVIAVVVALEKLWAHGPTVSRFVGAVNLALAMLVLVVPQVAVALHGGPSMMSH